MRTDSGDSVYINIAEKSFLYIKNADYYNNRRVFIMGIL